MTYSETREMYTFFYSRRESEKKERLDKLLSFFKLLFSWFIPWTVTALSVAVLFDATSVLGLLFSIVILFLSFLYYRLSNKKDKSYALFCVIFSYLISLSAALTALS